MRGRFGTNFVAIDLSKPWIVDHQSQHSNASRADPCTIVPREHVSVARLRGDAGVAFASVSLASVIALFLLVIVGFAALVDVFVVLLPPRFMLLKGGELRGCIEYGGGDCQQYRKYVFYLPYVVRAIVGAGLGVLFVNVECMEEKEQVCGHCARFGYGDCEEEDGDKGYDTTQYRKIECVKFLVIVGYRPETINENKERGDYTFKIVGRRHTYLSS